MIASSSGVEADKGVFKKARKVFVTCFIHLRPSQESKNVLLST